MPFYDYACKACGTFTALRPMAEFRDPTACPTCGEAAPRVLVSAPNIAALDPPRRQALAAREKKAGEPRRPSHPAGCSCCTRRLPWPVQA